MIRIAKKEDIDNVAGLAHMMWTDSSTKELIEEFNELVENDEAVIFVTEENEQIIGFAQCQLRHDYVEGTESSPVGYLEGIFVREDYWKMQIRQLYIDKGALHL